MEPKNKIFSGNKLLMRGVGSSPRPVAQWSGGVSGSARRAPSLLSKICVGHAVARERVREASEGYHQAGQGG